MLNHNFTAHTLPQLFDLKTGFQATLNNPRCKAISEPVKHTIGCIDKELLNRGYKPIKTNKWNRILKK